MYCSAQMPTPSASASAAVPEDLDALVRAALNGGRVDQVREALEARVVPAADPISTAVPSEPAPAPPPRAAPRPAARHAPRAAPPPVALPSARPPSAGEADGVFDALAATAARARGAWRSGDAAAVSRTLGELQATLAEARLLAGGPELTPAALPPDALDPVEPGAVVSPLVELPPYRHPWLLVVEGAGDPQKARVLAASMDVDLPTAQQTALSPYPRVALRSDERLTLDRKAGRIQAMAGLRAAVVSRDALVAMGAPLTALGATGVSRFSVVDGAAWRGSEDHQTLGPGLIADTTGVALAVPGDVIVRKYRVGVELGRGRGRVVKVAGERRVAVIDLHGRDCFVRVVQAVTDLRGLPGHDTQSTLRSMRGLADKLWQWWPQAKALPARTARPGDMPSLEEVAAQPDGLERAGWAAWEEHSRMARLLAGLA
jgi:hypothetical protein